MMSKKEKKYSGENIPELRFPEFKGKGEWNIESLGDISDEIIEKTKGRKYKLMSITSGVGLVSQIEKFGREIAGDSYKNYYVLQNGDFAYNKSATKLYGEGEIALYGGDEIAAVPNSIFTCFRFHLDKIYPVFAKYPFINNLHGNWLKKFISVGARANGALQVNIRDLFSLPFPYPSLLEQQKIASCLSSLDEVIVAHSQKLELLKEHKKGLMQNLFPKEGEKVPKLRFKEFEKDGEWVEKKLGEIGEPLMCKRIFKEQTTADPNKGVPFYKIGTFGKEPDAYISAELYEEYKDKYSFPKVGDILISASGTIGRLVVYDGSPGYFQDSNIVWLDNNEKTVQNNFLYHCYSILKWQTSDGGVISRLYNSDLRKMRVKFPKGKKEQQKIAACFSSLDALIIVEGDKIAQLKQHKKGLMQGLFPQMNG